MALGVGPSLPIPLTSSVVVVVAAVVAANADNSIVFVVLVVGIIVAALALALVNDIVVRNFAREPVQHTTMENNTAAGKQTDRQLLLD